ncbi:MAG TPA: serine/threonine-protein kinase [Labilithrix sp.]
MGRKEAFSFLVSNDSLESRALFQDRLALFAKLVFYSSGGFFVFGLAEAALLHPDQLGALVRQTSSVLHGGAILLALALWRIVGGRVQSARMLDVWDASGTLAVCGIYAAMMLGHAPTEPVDLVVVLATSWILVVRAALVPSNAARTALIGAACIAPALACTWITFASSDPLVHLANAGAWSAVAIATTSAVSFIIYGLRQKVRAAMHLGQYTLVEKIGAGGMGVVYRARHAMLRRPTAIKLLPKERSGEDNLARFEREVQAASRLTHPNTIAIYDYGRTPDGIFYYAMELLDGISLEDLVREDGPQPPARVAAILRQICGALNEAHEAGLVHRDVKPSNVLLCERGGMVDVVKVLDFGLVKSMSMTAGGLVTDTNVVAGTPLYLSPEALTSPSTIDGRADLYALGATAYFLLTGHTVFDGKSAVEVCGRHLHDVPVPPSKRAEQAIPEDLERIVLRCLEKERSARFASAAAMGEALASCSSDGWSDSRARAWWKKRGADLLRALRVGKSRGSAPNVAVDLDDRGDKTRLSA